MPGYRDIDRNRSDVGDGQRAQVVSRPTIYRVTAPARVLPIDRAASVGVAVDTLVLVWGAAVVAAATAGRPHNAISSAARNDYVMGR